MSVTTTHPTFGGQHVAAERLPTADAVRRGGFWVSLARLFLPSLSATAQPGRPPWSALERGGFWVSIARILLPRLRAT